MANQLSEHLEEVGESYGRHLAAASGFGLRMVLTGLACIVHGILPFLFRRTGSEMVRRLHGEMVVRRRRADDEHWVI